MIGDLVWLVLIAAAVVFVGLPCAFWWLVLVNGTGRRLQDEKKALRYSRQRQQDQGGGND